MNATTHEPLAIASADISTLARESRERALAARQALAELTPQQAAEVGGAYYIEPFPWGTLPFWKLADTFKTPLVDSAAIGSLKTF